MSIFCIKFFSFDFFVDFLLDFFFLFFSISFSGPFDTNGPIISLLVPEIEGGYPERHGGEGAEGEEEGLVLEYSSSWMISLIVLTE